MSRSLEDLLDATLDTRRQRRTQHEAEQTAAREAIRVAHAKIECEQTRFYSEVRSLLEQVVERANRHLAKRPEHCEVCDISGQYTGPLFVGAATCTPIVYQLRAEGAPVGEPLLVELTHDGMVEAWLCQSSVSLREADHTGIDFGWQSVPLDRFNADAATDLMVRYVVAITKRARLGQHTVGSADCREVSP
jgi:hypothetical protein